MLRRTGTILAVSAGQVTVQLTPELVCQKCPGCSGLSDSELILPSSGKLNVADSVDIAMESRQLRRLAFRWFALPVVLLIVILAVADSYAVPEVYSALAAIIAIAVLFWALGNYSTQSPNLFHVVTLLNNHE